MKKSLPLILFLVLAASCSDHGKVAPSTEVRIGVIAYLQGEQVALAGTPTVNAARMAVGDLASSGGLSLGGRKREVRLVVESVDNVPEQTVAAAERLINQEDVCAIIGPQFSQDAIPTGGVAEASRVPMICPIATNPRVTLDRKWVFRMSFVDDYQGRIMARFARHDLGAMTAAVLFDVANAYNRDISDMFRQAFEREGGAVVSFESYTSGEKDFEKYLERIRRKNPDVLFLPNYSSDAAIQGKQARRIGVRSVLLGSDGWDQRRLPELAAFDGSFMPGHWSPFIEDPRVQRFVGEYRSRFGEEPNDAAALTYDAVDLLFRVMKEQGSADPARIGAGIYSLGPFNGLTGTVDFVQSGDPVKGAIILRFENGRSVFYRQVGPI